MTDLLDADWAGLGHHPAPARRPTLTTDAHGFTVARQDSPSPEPLAPDEDASQTALNDYGDLDTWWAWISGRARI